MCHHDRMWRRDRWIGGWALAVLVATAACGGGGQSTPKDPEPLAIPKISAKGDARKSAPKQAPRGPKSTAQGWLRTLAQHDPQYTERPAVIDAMKTARKKDRLAILLVSVDAKIEECSSAGGSHAFLVVLEPALSAEEMPVVHFGGHGTMLMHAFGEYGQLWVAAVDIANQPYSSKNDGWCIPDRVVHGEASAMVPVATREEGRQLIDEIEEAATPPP